MIRPCQNSRMGKHHHGSVRNPKRHGLLQNIHQQTFHSECRRHPYRYYVTGEANMPSEDPILPPPPWFAETPQALLTTHEEIQPPAPLSDEISRGPEMTTAPSLSKRWRPGTLHFDKSLSKRWRAGALKPETPVSTPATRRWRAGFLCALRSISSESTVDWPQIR